jgi:Mg-chelatase subunit ChlD
MAIDNEERLRRWRLVLGGPATETTGVNLSGTDLGMDNVLAALYDTEQDQKRGGRGASMPNVSRWLGDIRTYFPSSTVRVMQQDALERLNLRQMLMQPEMLEAIDADVHFVATLLSLSRVIPEKTKETARTVVRKVVDDLMRKLQARTVQAVRGSLNRSVRSHRPRSNEIDWHRTIRANLKNYLPDQKTIIAERLVGYGRKRAALRDIVLCVDQSGSMATSVVYSGIFGAVLASIPALSTRMVVYDTAVVDLTDDLHDPVDLLFGTQLGGGNDTPRALAYCQQVITRPSQTIMVLITDCYEGAGSAEMLKRAGDLVASGVQLILLLALSDRGTPSYDEQQASAMARLGIPTFACSPDLFPDLMAAAIQRQDLNLWAARNDIVTARGT